MSLPYMSFYRKRDGAGQSFEACHQRPMDLRPPPLQFPPKGIHRFVPLEERIANQVQEIAEEVEEIEQVKVNFILGG